MIRFWETAARHLRRGEQIFLAFVAAHEEHSPGTAGAKLLTPEKGSPFGSVGGGIMEHDIIQRGQTLLAANSDFTPEIQTLDHRAKGRGTPSGLVCAGQQTNLYWLAIPKRDLPEIEKIIDLLKRDQPGILTISPEGLTAEPAPVDLDAPPVRLHETAEGWRYEEQLFNRKRLAILGGGHCALALSRTMQWLGFDVQVFDTRPGVPSFEKNRFARTIRVKDYADAGTEIPYPALTDVVLMTNDFHADVAALRGVLPGPFPYIGLMGSHAKIGRVFSALRKARFSKQDLSRVIAPVGLPIESDTPEEIAVSVAAQIIQRRNTAEAET